jgi:hypothetical protein
LYMSSRHLKIAQIVPMFDQGPELTDYSRGWQTGPQA